MADTRLGLGEEAMLARKASGYQTLMLLGDWSKNTAVGFRQATFKLPHS